MCVCVFFKVHVYVCLCVCACSARIALLQVKTLNYVTSLPHTEHRRHNTTPLHTPSPRSSALIHISLHISPHPPPFSDWTGNNIFIPDSRLPVLFIRSHFHCTIIALVFLALLYLSRMEYLLHFFRKVLNYIKLYICINIYIHCMKETITNYIQRNTTGISVRNSLMEKRRWYQSVDMCTAFIITSRVSWLRAHGNTACADCHARYHS